jgi:hypothetical protein
LVFGSWTKQDLQERAAQQKEALEPSVALATTLQTHGILESLMKEVFAGVGRKIVAILCTNSSSSNLSCNS